MRSSLNINHLIASLRQFCWIFCNFRNDSDLCHSDRIIELFFSFSLQIILFHKYLLAICKNLASLEMATTEIVSNYLFRWNAPCEMLRTDKIRSLDIFLYWLKTSFHCYRQIIMTHVKNMKFNYAIIITRWVRFCGHGQTIENWYSIIFLRLHTDAR